MSAIRTPASASAYLLLAESQRARKNFSEANATLQTFLDKFPQHELASTARLAMAANFESMGKLDEALSTLQRLVANYPKSFIAPLAMLSQVHLLKAKGQIADARRVCENMLTQYRESYLAGEASRQLRLLRPKGEAQSLPPAKCSPITVPQLLRLQAHAAPIQLRKAVEAVHRNRPRAIEVNRPTCKGEKLGAWAQALGVVSASRTEAFYSTGCPDFFRSFIRGSRRNNPSAECATQITSTCKGRARSRG